MLQFLILTLFFFFCIVNLFWQTRTVQVKQLSDLASEREIHEFFSFSGEIEGIQIQRYFYFFIIIIIISFRFMYIKL